jgi:hypothetical protein
MFIKVPTDIYVEVKDEDEAEAATRLIDSSGDQVLGNGFPHGEIASVDVPGGYETLTDEQVTEKGLTE